MNDADDLKCKPEVQDTPADGRAQCTSGHQEHTAGGKTYRQELVKCGRPGCQKCSAGAGHGPYWYAYWSEGGRTRKQYIGKKKPAELEHLAGN